MVCVLIAVGVSVVFSAISRRENDSLVTKAKVEYYEKMTENIGKPIEYYQYYNYEK